MPAPEWFIFFQEKHDAKLDNQTTHFDGKTDNLLGMVNNLQQSFQATEEKRKNDPEDNQLK